MRTRRIFNVFSTRLVKQAIALLKLAGRTNRMEGIEGPRTTGHNSITLLFAAASL
jgi:hypothetical protein